MRDKRYDLKIRRNKPKKEEEVVDEVGEDKPIVRKEKELEVDDGW